MAIIAEKLPDTGAEVAFVSIIFFAFIAQFFGFSEQTGRADLLIKSANAQANTKQAVPFNLSRQVSNPR